MKMQIRVELRLPMENTHTTTMLQLTYRRYNEVMVEKIPDANDVIKLSNKSLMDLD